MNYYTAGDPKSPAVYPKSPAEFNGKVILFGMTNYFDVIRLYLKFCLCS
jgi:hypothetical protein